MAWNVPNSSVRHSCPSYRPGRVRPRGGPRHAPHAPSDLPNSGVPISTCRSDAARRLFCVRRACRAGRDDRFQFRRQQFRPRGRLHRRWLQFHGHLRSRVGHIEPCWQSPIKPGSRGRRGDRHRRYHLRNTGRRRVIHVRCLRFASFTFLLSDAVDFIGLVGGVQTEALLGVASNTPIFASLNPLFGSPIDELLIVGSSQAQTTLVLDNFVFTPTEVPEPAMLLLLCTSLGAAAARRRGNRRT
jgi:hypothetical protein